MTDPRNSHESMCIPAWKALRHCGGARQVKPHLQFSKDGLTLVGQHVNLPLSLLGCLTAVFIGGAGQELTS